MRNPLLWVLIYLFFEIYVSVEIASSIGPIWTFVEVVASAFVGFIILANFRFRAVGYMRALAAGEIFLEEFQSLNLYSLIGAILLIVPGFLSDILGILLQFGTISMVIARRFLKRKQNQSSEVIDVEIIERDSSV